MTNGVNGMGVCGPMMPQRPKGAGTTAPGVDGGSPLAGPVSAGPVAGKGMRPQVGSQPARLPSVSSELRGIVRDISSRPPVDVSKVERLAGMVSSGGYRVDAARLADAMIASEVSGLKKIG